MPSRCPNGTRRNRSTGLCEKKSKSRALTKQAPRSRCPAGTRRNPSTGACVSILKALTPSKHVVHFDVRVVSKHATHLLAHAWLKKCLNDYVGEAFESFYIKKKSGKGIGQVVKGYGYGHIFHVKLVQTRSQAASYSGDAFIDFISELDQYCDLGIKGECVNAKVLWSSNALVENALVAH